MTKDFQIPFYAKTALIFISLFALVYTMDIAQSIIIPIVFAIILAILLNPVVNFLTRKKVNRVVAIFLVIIIALILILVILFIIFSQASHFSEALPEMEEKFNESKDELIHWLSGKLNMEVSSINDWIKSSQTNIINGFGITSSITKFGNLMISAVVLPVYLVLFLYYKPLLLDFIHRVFRAQHHVAVEEILTSTKKIIQSYLIGLFIDIFIVAILNSIGLLIIGIKYAVLLGALGALLNIIPYLGAIIATSIFMAVALLTESPIYMLYVFIMYGVIQFFENNFIIPKIVASRVKINALISIIVVIIGGAIWGIAGMFLAIPITAIIKVIFDHIEALNPWGFLLGDTVPTKKRFFLSRTKSKTKNA